MKRQIALVGVPGSAKSITAKAVEEALIRGDGTCEECTTPVAIIDDYAEAVGEAGDWALGFDGGWMTSLAVSVERYNRERKALSENNKTVITCGTILESSVYMSMHFEDFTKNLEGPELEDAFRRAEASMKLYACMYVDTFHYHRVFYLPSLETNPDTAPSAKLKMLDRNIQASFQAFNLTPIEPLIFEGETPAEIIAQRVEAILSPKETDASHSQRSEDRTPQNQ